MKAIKNDTEIDGMRKAYLRDSVSFVRFLAWLEYKISQGHGISEYEAAFRLTEYRRTNKHFISLTHEIISASGPNAALSHYLLDKSTAVTIDRDAPYLNDSGGRYHDGACSIARTWTFGRPTTDHCRAYTRALQRHIVIDSAIFTEGTTGQQLDALFGYGPEDGCGVGFPNMHEGPKSLFNNVTLVPGHVITNESGSCKSLLVYIEGSHRSILLDMPGKFGIRIKSALTVRRVSVKSESDDSRLLGFERLTCVPIQTKMIKGSMLSKEDKQWVKDHNRQCLERLMPYLRDDKRASKWLKREAEHGLGISLTSLGGISIGRG